MAHLCGFYSLLLRLSSLAGSHCPLQWSGGAARNSVGSLKDQGLWCLPQLTHARQGSWLHYLASTLHSSISHILQCVYRWKLVSSSVTGTKLPWQANMVLCVPLQQPDIQGFAKGEETAVSVLNTLGPPQGILSTLLAKWREVGRSRTATSAPSA